MKKKPVVYLIDEDPLVHQGWAKHFASAVLVKNFYTFSEFLEDLENTNKFQDEITCVITARYFQNEDIATPMMLSRVKRNLKAPIFLNWQGFIRKDEENLFDGKLFHRYGLRWSSLKTRIQKTVVREEKFSEKKEPQLKSIKGSMSTKKFSLENPAPLERILPEDFQILRPKKCESLLLLMANNAQGSHRAKIQELAQEEKESGIAFLEAIYDRLVKDKNTSPTCPSRYIHSSPVIAKRMLHEVLYQ